MYLFCHVSTFLCNVVLILCLNASCVAEYLISMGSLSHISGHRQIKLRETVSEYLWFM